MLAKKLITNSNPGMILRKFPQHPAQIMPAGDADSQPCRRSKTGFRKQPKKAAFQATAADGEVRPLQNSVIFAISVHMRRRESLSAIGIPVLILSRIAGSLRT